MLNLGQIQFGLGVDTRQLLAATQRMVNFGRAVNAAAQAQGAGARLAEAAMRRQEAAMTRALGQVQRLNDAIRRSTTGNNQAQMLGRTAAAFNQLSQQMTMGTRTAIAYQRANESFAASLNTVQRRLAQLRAEEAARRKGMTAFGETMRSLTSATVIALGPLSGLGARIASFSALTAHANARIAILVSGVIGLGTAFYKLSTASIRTAIDVERIMSRLTNATGAVELAKLEFQGLQSLADRTGQNFVSLADQFTRFQAAAQGTSLEGDKARQVFENLAFAVGNFQLDAVSAEGVFRAVEQMMSKGTVSAEELRQQLGDRLPGAFKAAADAVGVTTAKLNELLKKGKISSEQFLLPFSEQIRKRLGGSAETIDGLRASINRFQNALTNFFMKFDEAFGVSQKFKAGLDAMTGALNWLGENINAVAAALGVFAGALGIVALPGFITGVTTAAGAVRLFVGSLLGLGAIATGGWALGLLSVFTRLAVLVGGATLGIKLFGSTSAVAAEAEQKLKTATDNLNMSIGGQASVVQKNAQEVVKAIGVKIEAMYAEVAAMRMVEFAQRQIIRNFDAQMDAGKKWYQFGIDEWASRLIAGAKQRHGGMSSSIDPIMKEMEKLQGTFNALQSRMKGGGSSGNFLFDEDGKLDRAGRRARDATQAIQKLREENQKMLEGPRAFEEWQKQFEINDKIQQFKDSLMDAGLSVGEVNRKVAEYTEALKTNVELQKGQFAAMQAMYDTFKQSATTAFDGVADAFGKAVVDGKLSADSFVDIVKQMTSQIISQLLKMAIFNPILNSIFPGMNAPSFGGGLGGLFQGLFAKGGAFGAGGVQMMAKGGILGKPHLFSTSSGPAMAGEAGPEAVMPLVRTSGGDLGVKAAGMGNTAGNKTVVNVITPPGTTAETRRSSNGNQELIEVVIKEVNKAIAGGKADSAMRSRFGSRPKLSPIS